METNVTAYFVPGKIKEFKKKVLIISITRNVITLCEMK